MGIQPAPVVLDGQINRQLLTDTYIDWLDEFEYDSFTTFTFRGPYKDYFKDRQVNDIFKNFMWRMNRRIHGHNFYRKDSRVSLVYIIDNDMYDGKHIHTLIKQSDKLHNKKTYNKNIQAEDIIQYEWWQSHHSTGHIHYETYNRNERARAYLTGKEIYKGGELCFDYFHHSY